MLSFLLNLFSRNPDRGRSERVEPTISKTLSLSPFEVAAEQLATDGNMRFNRESLKARIKGDLN